MCGRCFTYSHDEVRQLVRDIERGVAAEVAQAADAPVHQAFPKSVAPLIVPTFDTTVGPGALGPGSLEVRDLSWGFAEPWKSGVVFNTRIESADKPTWRESMEHRRCVIPVPGFFETHHSETYPSPKTGKPLKRQYEFHVPGQGTMFIGCTWRDDCFSMVTTEANGDMAPIHPRMPLIVRQDELPLWFGPEYQRLADRSSVRLEAKPAV